MSCVGQNVTYIQPTTVIYDCEYLHTGLPLLLHRHNNDNIDKHRRNTCSNFIYFLHWYIINDYVHPLIMSIKKPFLNEQSTQILILVCMQIVHMEDLSKPKGPGVVTGGGSSGSSLGPMPFGDVQSSTLRFFLSNFDE